MSDYGGRCVKAAQDIDEGELIVAGEPPLVHAINDGATRPFAILQYSRHQTPTVENAYDVLLAASSRLACHWTYAPIDIDDEEEHLFQSFALANLTREF